MKSVLIFIFFLVSAPSLAKVDAEDEMFSILNEAISNLGERIEYCRNVAAENKPSKSTILYLRGKPESFFSSLAYLDYLAMEKCTLEEKKDLAYILLSIKNKSVRESTISLIESTEKLTFSSDYSQKAKFESLDKESKEFLLSSEFFSVPFDILELFEQVAEE
ncbi:hypothetical protein BOO29_18835 [Vibrio navarrensis]|uniref:Uncharacterized protein n=1 Tax=Vibrio navarrensis TaxID=29495 RepID=A0AAI9CYD9_9VIBR|nr:hypothetical protein [Vibrio navarrensis]EGR2798336.1 hypothetical protein [Vibrio navarrensis]EHA1127876.1 hypothetical protein [Vibrio navarrensis]EJK2117009.1 hypothetical protein [Vibrio navarrensis]EJL6396866.1 hypothetical protein [Vibrio navarrensis]EKA5638347.1 hypothetical protein [Vibrio navarrensis]